jgi:hypothetical protein
LSHGLIAVIDSLFEFLGIQIFEWVMKPGLIGIAPVVEGGPQVVEWLEFLEFISDLSVVCRVLISEHLSVVKDFSLVLSLLNLLEDLFGDR